MNLAVLSRSFSDIFHNQKSRWHLDIGSTPCLNQCREQRHRIRSTALQQAAQNRNVRPDIKVEGIKVSSDRKYMYCQGCIRSQGSISRLNVVVAVEWLDKNRKALNTDWKRVELGSGGEPAPMLPDSARSFVVQARLDRRVKWVQAYAFSSNP